VYPLDLASLRGVFAARTRTTTRPLIERTVWPLGLINALTDVSSKTMSSILPALFVQLQLSPIQFGLVDGFYQAIAVLARLASGIAADRSRRYKLVAAHRAAVFSVHRSLDTVGALIGPLIAFALLRFVPSRFDAVFVSSFAIAVVGFAVLILLVDERPSPMPNRPPSSGHNLGCGCATEIVS